MPFPGLIAIAPPGMPFSDTGRSWESILFQCAMALTALLIAYGLVWMTAWLTGGQTPSIKEAFKVLGSYWMIGQRGRIIRALLPGKTPQSIQPRKRNGNPPEEASGPPGRIATLFKLYPGHWGLAGGWATALFTGGEPLEDQPAVIAVPRRDANHLWQHLLGWHPHYLTAGATEPVRWENSEPLPPGVTRLTAKPVSGDVDEIEILLLENDGDDWVHRRGGGKVRLPLDEVFTTSTEGIPVIAPEVNLLLAAESGGDGADDPGYTEVTAALGYHRREWLTRALIECGGEE